MDWSLIFTAIWAGIKAFFGISDKEKLGIVETTNKELAEDNKVLNTQLYMVSQGITHQQVSNDLKKGKF